MRDGVPWLAEADVERVVFDAADRALGVGARRRLFTGADRRAVEVRDRECTSPLCDVPAEDCEVDHVVPFAEGGPTAADNGRLACGFHNRSRPGAQRPEPPEPPEGDERGPPGGGRGEPARPRPARRGSSRPGDRRALAAARPRGGAAGVVTAGKGDRPGAGVWLITGAQASGKTTVADLLARRFDRGVHVRGGQFFRWAVRGWVNVGDEGGEEEIRRLLGLRYRLSSVVADEYAAAGFTTVVQDNIYGPDVEAWLARIRARPRHLVVLRPAVAVVEQRDEERRRRTGKVAYRGGFTPAVNDEHLARTRSDLGLWLDTSDQTPEETVEEILVRAAEAGVPEGAL